MLQVSQAGQGASPQNGEWRRMLILDFDGVVVDTEQVHFESWNAAFQQTFNTRMSGDYRQIVGLSLDELFRMWKEQNLLPELDLSEPEKLNFLDRKTQHFYAIGSEHLKPMRGLIRLVQGVREKGWYVAIASRSRRLRLLKTLELVQLTIPFDLILGTEDSVNSLTDRKEHHRAAHLFGIDASACVVIEDSPAGIADAIASSIGKVIGLTTSFDRHSLFNAGAHSVIDSLEQLLEEKILDL